MNGKVLMLAIIFFGGFHVFYVSNRVQNFANIMNRLCAIQLGECRNPKILSGVPLGCALGNSLGLRPYFAVYPLSRPNTDTINSVPTMGPTRQMRKKTRQMTSVQDRVLVLNGVAT